MAMLSRGRAATLLAVLLSFGCGSSGDAPPDAGFPDAMVVDAGAGDAADEADAAPVEACVPDCAGRACGDDGCGGSCGTCTKPLACGDKGTCVPQCPCYLGQCANCYCATAAEQYAVKNDCAIPAYEGNEGALLSCSGSSTSPADWTVGQQCANGCVVAPPKVPDYCAPPPSNGHKLWIAFDAVTAPSMTHTNDFFTCVFQHSNFDQLATAYGSGRSFAAVGGVAQLTTSCATVHAAYCASVGDDAVTLQCIENQTKWVMAPDDILLYYPATATKKGSDCSCTTCNYTGGCQDGRNHWHIPVTLPNSTSVSVEAAFGFTGSGAGCQTALGLHEAYEAAAESDAADCCNGQKSCYKHEPSPPFGWYSGTGCNQSWELQYLSPAGQVWNPSACAALTFK